MKHTITRRHALATPLLPLVTLATPPPAAATNADGLIRTQSSPKAALHGFDLDAVTWTSGFWAQRFEQTRRVTLRKLWDLLADPDAGHVLTNFRIAAGLEKGEHAGTNWQDAWLYKWIEAGTAVHQQTGEAWIAGRIAEATELIAGAIQPDGYISTQITIPGKKRWQDPREHEAYVMGHLLTAACVHRRVTGDDALFNTAVRVADFLSQTLGVSVDPGFAHNPTAVMGLVEMYRETRERRYLDGAQRIVDGRGHKPKPGGIFYQGPGTLGTDFFQDRTPFREAREVVGHNVFFTYLFAGAADLYMETGDETLMPPLERYWRDLTERKMCVNGGVSPMGTGLSAGRDPVIESVGRPYFLPVADSYNETCGQVGNLMWNYRMLLINPEARFADVMEVEMFNGFLGGIGLDGESWFYRNPLRRYDKDYAAHGINDMSQRSQPGRNQICCPTNLLRTFAELHNYIYGVSEDGLWVHHYGGCKLDGELSGGNRIAVTQETDYPWSGTVKLRIDAASSTREFTIHLRIPGWADGSTIEVNGKPAPPPAPGTYAALRQTWKAGDTITLNLPMEVRLMHAHPKAEQLRNQIAVMRGPILYCLESPDLPASADLNNVYLPSDAQFQPEPASDLPFGIVALKTRALYRPEPEWTGELYRRLEPRPMKPLPVRLIPYFAWANRGSSTMTTWMPLVLRT